MILIFNICYIATLTITLTYIRLVVTHHVYVFADKTPRDGRTPYVIIYPLMTVSSKYPDDPTDLVKGVTGLSTHTPEICLKMEAFSADENDLSSSSKGNNINIC